MQGESQMVLTGNTPAVGGNEPHRGVTKWLGLVFWVVVCLGAAAPGASFSPDDWYAKLNRPAFVPPDAVFGWVWSVLYLSMAVAAWSIWKRARLQNTWLPLSVFLLQLILNAAWTWLFFGLHRIDLAFFDILLLLAGIVATIVLFLRHGRIAGWLLLPYLAWVAFASVLNFEYWRLNT